MPSSSENARTTYPDTPLSFRAQNRVSRKSTYQVAAHHRRYAIPSISVHLVHYPDSRLFTHRGTRQNHSRPPHLPSHQGPSKPPPRRLVFYSHPRRSVSSSAILRYSPPSRGVTYRQKCCRGEVEVRLSCLIRPALRLLLFTRSGSRRLCR